MCCILVGGAAAVHSQALSQVEHKRGNNICIIEVCEMARNLPLQKSLISFFISFSRAKGKMQEEGVDPPPAPYAYIIEKLNLTLRGGKEAPLSK